MLQGNYFILVESLPGKYRKAVLSSVWMDTFCQTVWCMLPLCHQDSNGWKVNGTPNLRTVRQILRVLSQVASDNVLAQPSIIFEPDF